MLTARRPLVESALADAAEKQSGVTVRRGVGVGGLVTGRPSRAGVAHIRGVRTTVGEELAADLVVDMTGRRSPLPRWLAEVGAMPPRQVCEDSGFVYYSRHYRSPTGVIPMALGPLLQHPGTISSVTLPADNGTWSVVLVAAAADPDCLRALVRTALLVDPPERSLVSSGIADRVWALGADRRERPIPAPDRDHLIELANG